MLARLFIATAILYLSILPEAAFAIVPMPYRVGGTVIIDGVQLTQGTGAGYIFEVTDEFGTPYEPTAEDTNGLNSYGWYLIDIPIYDQTDQPGGGNTGDTAVIHVYDNGAELELLTPVNGQISIGESGKASQINVFAIPDSGDEDNDQDGYSPNQGDCNDNNAGINPEANDTCGDGVDTDCDGSDLCSGDQDNDNDGYSSGGGDCNDNDASIYPGTADICGDGVDRDCDGNDLCSGDETIQSVGAQPANGQTGVSLSPELYMDSYDSGGTHAETQWQIAKDESFQSLVFDIRSPIYLTAIEVPDLVLDEYTLYYWRVRFFDSLTDDPQWSETLWFRSQKALNDLNSNGVLDDQEVDRETDMDGDLVPDILQQGIKCVRTVVGNETVGVKASSNVTSVVAVKSIDPVTVTYRESQPDNFIQGIISFKIEVANAGDTAMVYIYFSKPVPSGISWYKFDLINGWQDYFSHAIVSDDRGHVFLELKDGGFGDADGTKNGIIVDPSGLIQNSGSGGGGGGSGGICFIETVRGRLD